MPIEAKDKDLDRETSSVTSPAELYVPLGKAQNTGRKVVAKFEIKD